MTGDVQWTSGRYILKRRGKKKETNKSVIYRIYTTSRSIWFIQLENRKKKQNDGFDASN